MDTRRLVTPWDGWGWYDDLYLVDPEGNRYSQTDIRSSHFAHELAHHLMGSPLQVLILRDRLRQQLEQLGQPPEIVIRWQGIETVVSHPGWKLKR